MSTQARRSADRVELGVPVQIYTPKGYLDATLCDISRTGLRFRLRAHTLQVEKIADHASTAKAVGETLASHFSLDLDYKKLGPLLQHAVSLTRLGIPEDEPLHVEIGCSFDEPLSDEEAAILGTDIPAVPGAPVQWVAPTNVPRRCEGIVRFRPSELLEDETTVGLAKIVHRPGPRATPGPVLAAEAPVRHRYRALVTGRVKNAPPSFFCYTDLVTAIGVRVSIPRPAKTRGVSAAMAALIKAHGGSVDLRILDEAQDVWTGQARVTGIELPPSRPDVMLVTLAYGSPLTMRAMRGLGLVRAA